MTPTRRSFMRQVGVSLAALLASGCVPSIVKPTPTCYAPQLQLIPTPAEQSGPWGDLRACWLALGDPRFLAKQIDDWVAAERAANAFAATLRERHQIALDALVADGALSATVAVEIGTAFQEATDHLSGRFVSCYAPQQPGEISPRPTREELTLQAAALTEMAQRSDIDPGTVAKAQATLERDMAWLAQFRATRQPDDISTITASPAEIEAADILVELLLGRK